MFRFVYSPNQARKGCGVFTTNVGIGINYNRCLLTILVVMAIAASGRAEEFSSGWAEATITIDGHMDDWKGLPTKLFTDANAALSVGNDQDYLYVLFRTVDHRWARTIMMSGLKLYFNSRGKEKKDFWIKFTGGPTKEQLNAISGMSDDRPPDSRPRGIDRDGPMIAGQEPRLSCFIKNRIIEKPIPADGGEGPAAAFDTSLGFFTYEFRIPLDTSVVRYYGIGAEAGQEIAIGAEWGGMDEMKRQMPGGEHGGGMGGGRMGGRGGGMGGGKGGRGGGPGMSRPEKPQKKEIWLKTRLADPGGEETTTEENR